MFISSSVFLLLVLTRIALHEEESKITIINLILGLELGAVHTFYLMSFWLAAPLKQKAWRACRCSQLELWAYVSTPAHMDTKVEKQQSKTAHLQQHKAFSPQRLHVNTLIYIIWHFSHVLIWIFTTVYMYIDSLALLGASVQLLVDATLILSQSHGSNSVRLGMQTCLSRPSEVQTQHQNEVI